MNANELKLLELNDKLSGIFTKDEISIEMYHSADCPGISKSGLDLIAKYPALYKHRRIDHVEAAIETAAFKFGNAVHTAILEPELFEEKYITDEQFMSEKPSAKPRATKAYKEAYHAFKFENPYTLVISSEDMKKVKDIKKAIGNHPIAKNLFKRGRAEQSIFWKEENGVICKTRADYLREDTYIIDLKTCADITEFEKSCGNYRYHAQAHMLARGAKSVTRKDHKVIFCTIESSAPHGIRVVELDPQAISLGECEFRDNLETFKACKESGIW